MICVSSICCFRHRQLLIRKGELVIQKAPQSGCYSQRRESASHFSENTNNDLPFVKKLQISCSVTNTISPFSKIFSIPKVMQKAPQSGCYSHRQESASHFLENTNNDLPFVKKHSRVVKFKIIPKILVNAFLIENGKMVNNMNS